MIASAIGERQIFPRQDRKSTRLNSSHSQISYAVFCLKKKTPIDPVRLQAVPSAYVRQEPYHRRHRILPSSPGPVEATGYPAHRHGTSATSDTVYLRAR